MNTLFLDTWILFWILHIHQAWLVDCRVKSSMYFLNYSHISVRYVTKGSLKNEKKNIINANKFCWKSVLTHCVLVTLYSDIELDHV